MPGAHARRGARPPQLLARAQQVKDRSLHLNGPGNQRQHACRGKPQPRFCGSGHKWLRATFVCTWACLQWQVYAALGGAGSPLAQMGPLKAPKPFSQNRKQRRTEATEHRPHEARKRRPGSRKKRRVRALNLTKNDPEMLSEQLPRSFEGPKH